MRDFEIEKSKTSVQKPDFLTIDNRLEIIEEIIRRRYLSRLTEMQIASIPEGQLLDLEDELIDNIRLYHIREMAYQKGEPITDKLTTVYNTISTYNATVFIILDSDGRTTDFYIGVRNNEQDDNIKRSTVTIGDTLKNTLVGHFPGIKIENKDRKTIRSISTRICSMNNVASVSVAGNTKIHNDLSNEQFIQGLEKLVLAMSGRDYIGILIAENQSVQEIQRQRKLYQDLYTKLSPLQKEQLSENYSESISRQKSFTEMSGAEKAAILGGAALNVAGVALGAAIGGIKGNVISGSVIGGQIVSPFGAFVNSLAPTEQISRTAGTSTSTTIENKAVTELLQLLDDALKRVNEFDSYGMWNVAGYFVSNDMSAAEIAASNYRSLMNGEKSGRLVSAINTWRKSDNNASDFNSLTKYLSRFVHPKFIYGANENYVVLRDASVSISGKELGIQMGIPRSSVPGLPVIEHAEFSKEVYKYQQEKLKPEERMTLGKVFDLGKTTDKIVELDNKSLNMHTFITGSTGSGKSTAVYQFLTELHQDRIPFLVIEPAKGEYKDVFGHWNDVHVFATNPNIAPMININPFKFPDSIHVLEHVDGLVEIFSVCWPMYDAMPAFFKDAILQSYESVGWDLGLSTFDGDKPEYPDFEILAEKLDELIERSDYASDIKSNYRGALITRVKSLTVGLNKYMFTTEQTPYELLFDKNCILDISRIKSTETKALIMGLMVYILNEYRVDQKKGSNNDLKHITVLEEAHNLLKNTQGGSSELVGKSVEMLTQTIAEIRTYGEGFVIVDQSPSSVDIAAIKNTNTKIVLRTPEANDREAVGLSMGLTPDQVNEIAKLPKGVAVVYQNDWVSPVLTIIDNPGVRGDIPYENTLPIPIKSLKVARTEIICALMQPWLKKERLRIKELHKDLKVLDLKRRNRKEIEKYLDDYIFFNGRLFWSQDEIIYLQEYLKDILQISRKDFLECLSINSPDRLRYMVSSKVAGLEKADIDEICNVLTKRVNNEC